MHRILGASHVLVCLPHSLTCGNVVLLLVLWGIHISAGRCANLLHRLAVASDRMLLTGNFANPPFGQRRASHRSMANDRT